MADSLFDDSFARRAFDLPAGRFQSYARRKEIGVGWNAGMREVRTSIVPESYASAWHTTPSTGMVEVRGYFAMLGGRLRGEDPTFMRSGFEHSERVHLDDPERSRILTGPIYHAGSEWNSPHLTIREVAQLGQALRSLRSAMSI